MRLLIDPAPTLPVFGQDLNLVIRVGDGVIPEIHVARALPKPDRHLLLGIVQSVAMAVTEKDRDLVVFTDPISIELDMEGEIRTLEPGLIIVRDETGRLAVLAGEDPRGARLLAREALRWFTGTIRLDVP